MSSNAESGLTPTKLRSFIISRLYALAVMLRDILIAWHNDFQTPCFLDFMVFRHHALFHIMLSKTILPEIHAVFYHNFMITMLFATILFGFYGFPSIETLLIEFLV